MAVIVVVAGLLREAPLLSLMTPRLQLETSSPLDQFDMTVDSFGAIYNGNDVNNASWSARNLTDEKFFTLQRSKPADIYKQKHKYSC